MEYKLELGDSFKTVVFRSWKSLLLGIWVVYFHDLPNIPLKMTFNLSWIFFHELHNISLRAKLILHYFIYECTPIRTKHDALVTLAWFYEISSSNVLNLNSKYFTKLMMQSLNDLDSVSSWIFVVVSDWLFVSCENFKACNKLCSSPRINLLRWARED